MTDKQKTWSKETVQLAEKLHLNLSLSDKNWHKLKNNHAHRAAELLSAAIVQLLQKGEASDIEALTEQSMLWLKKEINDPGCPHR